MHRTGYILIVLSLLIVQVANAQTIRPKASNYVMPTDVQAVGGGEAAKSTKYILDDTIGEPNIGAGRSDNYDVNAGYRQTSDNAYIALNCTDTTNMGTISFSGQANANATCTVTTDADAGYSLSWRAGTNNTNGLVGHWKLDETTGTTSYDSAGSQYNGDVTGAAISTDIPSNYLSTRSLDFDGSNDYLEVPDSTAWDFGTSDVTLSTWVKFDTLKSSFFMQQKSGGSNGGFEWWYSHSEQLLRFSASNATGIIAKTWAPVADTWYHISYTRSGNVHTLYVNGRSIGSATDAAAVADVAGVLRIGARDLNGTYEHNGKLDDIRVYDRSLSYAEIQTLASKAPPGSLTLSGSQVTSISPIGMPFTGGLLGHWKFDEIPSGGVAADSSGYGNSGTPAGATGTNNTPQPSTSVPSGANHITARSLDFDATDDIVSFGSPAILDNIETSAGMTASAWINSDVAGSSSAGTIFNKGTFAVAAGEGDWMLRLTSNNRISFEKGHATTLLSVVSGNNVITTGRWHHVLVTWDGSSSASNVHIYVDGVETSYVTQQSGVGAKGSDAASSLHMGAAGGTANRLFDGKIDDPRLYGRVLSAQEIAALAALPQAWTVANTDARWGARLSSTSTDTDAKWGTDSSSEKWLNVGEGSYPLVTRTSRTAVSGSTEVINFRSEIGATKIQEPGLYNAAIVLTAAAL